MLKNKPTLAIEGVDTAEVAWKARRPQVLRAWPATWSAAPAKSVISPTCNAARSSTAAVTTTVTTTSTETSKTTSSTIGATRVGELARGLVSDTETKVIYAGVATAAALLGAKSFGGDKVCPPPATGAQTSTVGEKRPRDENVDKMAKPTEDTQIKDSRTGKMMSLPSGVTKVAAVAGQHMNVATRAYATTVTRQWNTPMPPTRSTTVPTAHTVTVTLCAYPRTPSTAATTLVTLRAM